MTTYTQNTLDILACCGEAETAAKLCADFELDGYDDWFLPSMDEFNLIYENIGQGNVLELGNFGNFGNNSYLEFFTGRWRCVDTEFSW